MGIVIYTSDGAEITLPAAGENIIEQIADALDRSAAEKDGHGRLLPRGFMALDEDNGRERLINAAQITRVEHTQP